MKTAMELIEHRSDDDDCKCLICTSCVTCDDGRRDMLELVAKRAREEMREMAASIVYEPDDDDTYLKYIADAIRSLPVEAKP